MLQEVPFCPGPGTLPDMLTLDFWVEGQVKQTPAQCGWSCLGSSEEEVQGAIDEIFFMETWCSIVPVLESTMFIGLFSWFLVATIHRGFTLGWEHERKDPSWPAQEVEAYYAISLASSCPKCWKLLLALVDENQDNFFVYAYNLGESISTVERETA